MENRLEELRKYVDDLVENNEVEKICTYTSHMYGVSKFCSIDKKLIKNVLDENGAIDIKSQSTILKF